MRRLSKFLYIVCVLAFVVAILGALGSFRMSLNGKKEISQYKTAQKNFDTKLEILKKELPYTIGGGIGQSRLCMLLLNRAHVGEVQASIWPQEMREECKAHNMYLL